VFSKEFDSLCAMCNTQSNRSIMGRGLDVAVARDFTYQKQNSAGRVIEAELDMNRLARRPSTGGRILDLWRWLMPLGRNGVGTPKRSIERELEEAWPSSDR
jgi:hypothetical protein